VVTDISHEGLRQLLAEEGVSFQAVRTWKRSNDPDFERRQNRILELYALAEAGKAAVICRDEFGPLEPPAPARRAGLGAPGAARVDASPTSAASSANPREPS
jgi:hypothetical protein